MSKAVASRNDEDAPRFAAFISYAHADAVIAAKLQSRLERYRLPKHIAEIRAGGGKALGQIFRDREDLAAAPNLSDAIRAAIAESNALLVICSPEAKASRWVGEEITLFRQLHPDRPILSALVSGEPDVAFPLALTKGGVEPLAADLRLNRDGEQLGFLKIVAGIANVPLDALIQRDAQRRLRRVTAITLGALAAMLVMGIMTTFAIQARNEAARQRASAEGLVEFMITDLGDRLDSVGRLEVMRSVNDRAISYYDRQSGNLPEDSENRRARVLHAIGDIEERQGNFDAALKHFQKAYQITDGLHRTSPSDKEHLFAHAQSEYWLGRIALRRDKYAEARQRWQSYLRLAQQLAKEEPGSTRSLLEQGYAQGNLCEVAFQESGWKADTALPHCRTALQLIEKAAQQAPKDPEVLLSLANRQGWMSDMAQVQDNIDDAIALRLAEARTIDSMLARDPGNIEYTVRRNMPVVSLLHNYIVKKRLKEAEAVLAPSIARIESAMKRAPDNPAVSIERLRLAYYEIQLARLRNKGWQDTAAKALLLSKQLQQTFGPELREQSSVFDAIERITSVNWQQEE